MQAMIFHVALVRLLVRIKNIFVLSTFQDSDMKMKIPELIITLTSQSANQIIYCNCICQSYTIYSMCY